MDLNFSKLGVEIFFNRFKMGSACHCYTEAKKSYKKITLRKENICQYSYKTDFESFEMISNCKNCALTSEMRGKGRRKKLPIMISSSQKSLKGYRL